MGNFPFDGFNDLSFNIGPNLAEKISEQDLSLLDVIGQPLLTINWLPLGSYKTGSLGLGRIRFFISFFILLLAPETIWLSITNCPDNHACTYSIDAVVIPKLINVHAQGSYKFTRKKNLFLKNSYMANVNSNGGTEAKKYPYKISHPGIVHFVRKTYNSSGRLLSHHDDFIHCLGHTLSRHDDFSLFMTIFRRPNEIKRLDQINFHFVLKK